MVVSWWIVAFCAVSLHYLIQFAINKIRLNKIELVRLVSLRLCTFGTNSGHLYTISVTRPMWQLSEWPLHSLFFTDGLPHPPIIQ